MNINSLPSLPLRMIFDQLPLSDVIQFGRVCPLWGEYQHEITSKINKLTLLLGPQNPFLLIKNSQFIIPNMDKIMNDDGTPFQVSHIDDTTEPCLEFALFDQDTCELLLSAFQNIYTLDLSISGLSCQVAKLIIILLERWSSKLTKLRIFCQFSCEENLKSANIAIILKLLKTINTLNLDHLTFELLHRFYPTHQSVNENFLGVKPHFELPILGRLQEFYFSTLDPIHRTPLFHSLKCYARNNDQLCQIGLGNWDKHLMFSWFGFKCPDLARRITSLPSVDWSNDLAERGPFQTQNSFSQFSSLTHVYFDYFAYHMSFSELINAFSGMLQLISLNLRLFLNLLNAERSSLPLSSEDYKEQSAFARLSSVKLLSISMDASAHSDIESVHWNWIFPNIQFLTIHHDCFASNYCYNPKCQHYGNIPSSQISVEQRLEDTRLMLSTFKQCDKLRRIVNKWCYPTKLSTEWILAEVYGRKLILRDRS